MYKVTWMNPCTGTHKIQYVMELAKATYLTEFAINNGFVNVAMEVIIFGLM